MQYIQPVYGRVLHKRDFHLRRSFHEYKNARVPAAYHYDSIQPVVAAVYVQRRYVDSQNGEHSYFRYSRRGSCRGTYIRVYKKGHKSPHNA